MTYLPIDYRANPNPGQQGDPPYRPVSHDHPVSDVAVSTAPQPSLPGRGYSWNEAPARDNVMQPCAPVPQAPDPYTGTTICDWASMDTGS